MPHRVSRNVRFEQFDRAGLALHSHHHRGIGLEHNPVRITKPLASIKRAAVRQLHDVHPVADIHPEQRLELLPLAGVGTADTQQRLAIDRRKSDSPGFHVRIHLGESQVPAIMWPSKNYTEPLVAQRRVHSSYGSQERPIGAVVGEPRTDAFLHPERAVRLDEQVLGGNELPGALALPTNREAQDPIRRPGTHSCGSAIEHQYAVPCKIRTHVRDNEEDILFGRVAELMLGFGDPDGLNRVLGSPSALTTGHQTDESSSGKCVTHFTQVSLVTGTHVGCSLSRTTYWTPMSSRVTPVIVPAPSAT